MLKDHRLFQNVPDSRRAAELVDTRGVDDIHKKILRHFKGSTQRLRAALKNYGESAGFLTHEALKRAVHRLKVGISSEEILQIVRYHDPIGNGFIAIDSLMEAIDSSLQSEDVLEVLARSAKKKIIDARKVVDGRKMMDILRRSDQSACGTIAKESFVRCLNWLGVPELTKGELNAILLASGATQSTSDRVDYEHFVIFVFAGNDASRDVEVESSLTRSLKLSREKLGAMLRSIYKALRGDILQSDDVLDRNTIRTILRKRGIVLGDADLSMIMSRAVPQDSDNVRRDGVASASALLRAIQSLGSSENEHRTAIVEAPWERPNSSRRVGIRTQIYEQAGRPAAGFQKARHLMRPCMRHFPHKTFSGDMISGMRLEPPSVARPPGIPPSNLKNGRFLL